MPNLPTPRRHTWQQQTDGLKSNHSTRIRTDADKMYHTVQWRNCRKKYITLNPLCEECRRKGITTIGTVVDHIKQVKKGGAKFDFENLQTLCDTCHARKSQKEGTK